MKVLVTGSSGFVGKHVVQELKDKHELFLPSSRELNILSSGYGDVDTLSVIEDYLCDNNIDAIVHLAATCGGIGINKDNPGRFIYENLQMGLNIFEAARLARVKKIVNLGTVCSYPKFADIPFRESELWNGYPEETNAPYGIAKKAIMELGKAYYKQYGINVTNLVPVNMAGEYDHFDAYSSHVIPAIIKKFEDVENPKISGSDVAYCHDYEITLWGSGRASREFLYAGDCAKAIAMALEKPTTAEPINLGTGREITIHDLAILIKHLGCYGATIIWDATKPDGQPRRCLDTRRAEQILGWKATTSLETIIGKTIDWYRKNDI